MDTYTDTQRQSYTQTHGYIHIHVHRYTHTDTETHRNVHIYTYIHTDPDTYPQKHTNRNVHSDIQTETQRKMDTHRHRHTYTDTYRHTHTHTRSAYEINKVTQMLTPGGHETTLTWHKADPLCLSSATLKAPRELSDLWEVKHRHLQTWVLLGELAGQDARAACEKQRQILDPPGMCETLGVSPEFNSGKTKTMLSDAA